MDPRAHVSSQGDTAPSSGWHGESSGTPSARQLTERLIHIWPDFDIKVVPGFVKAVTGLLVSNYLVGLILTFLCHKPSLLGFGVICLFGYLKWDCPTIGWLARNNEPPFNTFVAFDNCINTILWCSVLVFYVFKFLLDSDVRYSSVWCGKPQHQLRTCHFSNLYYDPQNGFLFVLDESSIISGIGDFEEFKHLKLSPISDHKGVNMMVTMVRSADFASLSPKFSYSSFFGFAKFIEEPHFLLYRFKPDNLMHVVHDDLIPLFFKFRELSAGNVNRMVSTTNLFFADMNGYGPYAEWYQALSSTTPLLAKGMSAEKMYCFSSLYLGASNTSFFQYGFNKPQGPIGPNLIGRDVREFKKYYLDYFGVVPDKRDSKLKVTLISREISRKIVNEDKIFNTLSTLVHAYGFYKGKVLVMAKGDMAVIKNKMLNMVASTDILVAMHGAETILSVFLPESSVFIEMFPFGISRDYVSPVYSLSKAKGVHFRYLSWDNVKEENSIAHPEYPKEFGGTEGYPEDLKLRMYDTKWVPAVPCCNNPYYLFRMYQDTIIDDSFSEVATDALKMMNYETPVVTAESQWFFPGPVFNLNCQRYSNYVNLSWTAPLNVGILNTKYDVLVSADAFHHNAFTYESMLRFDFGEHYQNIEVWVSSVVNGKKSFDSYCKCNFFQNKLNRHSL